MQVLMNSIFIAAIVTLAAGYADTTNAANSVSDTLLGGLMRWYAGGDDSESVQQALDEYEDKNQQQQLYRVAKEFGGRYQPRMDDLLLARGPSLRDPEYLEHSSLFGHQYMQGGAGEGSQHLKPDGSVNNVQVIKTDAALPAYCNPPNPCPNGYTSEDGCLEDFVNSAAFSREYQGGQECMCDTEHMFDCPGADNEAELDTLARTLQNRDDLNESDLDSFVNVMSGARDDSEHKVVAKKFFSKKANNPYLSRGQPLRKVVAKKSPHTSGVY